MPSTLLTGKMQKRWFPAHELIDAHVRQRFSDGKDKSEQPFPDDHL